jgi:hypothetical protein
VPRRVFGTKAAEAMGESGELHNEEPHDLYYSPSITRMI